MVRQDELKEIRARLTAEVETQMDAAREARKGLGETVDWQLLLAALNKIREADERRALREEEVALIPRSDGFLRALWGLLRDPVSFDPKTEDELLRQTEEDMGPKESMEADFCIRVLTFKDLADLKKVLDKVVADKPVLEVRANALSNYLSKYHSTGRLLIKYGGMTIANKPVGREVGSEDIELEEVVFATAVIDAYVSPTREVEVYKWQSLSFEVEDAISARADKRLDLYDSLVIDSIGFVGLNTASPGLVIDKVWPADLLAVARMEKGNAGADLRWD